MWALKKKKKNLALSVWKKVEGRDGKLGCQVVAEQKSDGQVWSIWILVLQGYDFEIRQIRGVTNCVADGSSRSHFLVATDGFFCNRSGLFICQ